MDSKTADQEACQLEGGRSWEVDQRREFFQQKHRMVWKLKVGKVGSGFLDPQASLLVWGNRPKAIPPGHDPRSRHCSRTSLSASRPWKITAICPLANPTWHRKITQIMSIPQNWVICVAMFAFQRVSIPFSGSNHHVRVNVSPFLDHFLYFRSRSFLLFQGKDIWYISDTSRSFPIISLYFSTDMSENFDLAGLVTAGRPTSPPRLSPPSLSCAALQVL